VATVGKASDTGEVAAAYFSTVGQRDLDAMVAFWEPGGVGEIHGLVELIAPDSYRAWFAGLFQAVPDFELKVLEIIASGEKAAVRWHATGTFDGSARFEGLVPNGSRIDLGGCDVIAVREGRLYRNDVYINGAEMARQLGALPPADSLPERGLIKAVNARTRVKDSLSARRS
jgi:predicted ester cyclase